MFDLKGKTALVTGSTQGIGFEIARTLAKQGAKVFVHGAHSMEKCICACREIPGAVPVQANLLSEYDIQKMFQQTENVDILVLNASIQYKKAWDAFTMEEYEEQMNCNLKSSYLLMKQYTPHMKEMGWGRIVTIGSVNQYRQHPELSLYGVSKAAQMKLVENIAPYLAPYGITVNNVSPGVIKTPRNDAVLKDPEFLQKMVERVPCGYIGTPQDIAPAVLLLCSPEGRYITGTDIVVDGGMRL